MGLAASQARFLSLTARKSNVEFQGQQINQQRTTLANESSAYNEQLLNMAVPTAPSTDSYTKVSYSFTNTATGNTCNISGLTANDDGTYDVAYTYNTTGSEAESGTALFYSNSVTNNGVTTTTYSAGSGSNQTALSPIDLASADSQDASNLKTIYGSSYATKDNTGNYKNTYYKYASGNEIRYVTLNDLQANANSGNNMTFHYVNDGASITEKGTIKNASVTYGSSGRLNSITSADGGTSYSMDVTTTTDTAAYNDAMNEYNYQKALYDQNLNQINAKLSVVQQQDKTLELKLKDLDTEQSALSTEMDAVKKVADKNIESSFKTFSA